MFKKLKTVALAASVAVVTSVPAMAQETSVVDTAASTFQSDFSAIATAIGGALITAGFGALVFKWAKGMLFS